MTSHPHTRAQPKFWSWLPGVPVPEAGTGAMGRQGVLRLTPQSWGPGPSGLGGGEVSLGGHPAFVWESFRKIFINKCGNYYLSA